MPRSELRQTLSPFKSLQEPQNHELRSREWIDFMNAVCRLFEKGYFIHDILRTLEKLNKQNMYSYDSVFMRFLIDQFIASSIRKKLLLCPELLNVSFGKAPDREKIQLFQDQFSELIFELNMHGYETDRIVAIFKVETRLTWITSNHIWRVLFYIQKQQQDGLSYLSGGRVKNS